MRFNEETIENTQRLIPGYAGLEPVEISRMFEFSLVWQIFEVRLLQNEEVAKTIQEFWYQGQQAEIAAQTENDFRFFKHRYQEADDATDRLDKLLGGQGENLRLCIVNGLNDGANDHQKIRACAAVCYRFRNNLFHGKKAEYGFDEQDANFIHAIHFMNVCLQRLV